MRLWSRSRVYTVLSPAFASPEQKSDAYWDLYGAPSKLEQPFKVTYLFYFDTPEETNDMSRVASVVTGDGDAEAMRPLVEQWRTRWGPAGFSVIEKQRRRWVPQLPHRLHMALARFRDASRVFTSMRSWLDSPDTMRQLWYSPEHNDWWVPQQTLRTSIEEYRQLDIEKELAAGHAVYLGITPATTSRLYLTGIVLDQDDEDVWQAAAFTKIYIVDIKDMVTLVEGWPTGQHVTLSYPKLVGMQAFYSWEHYDDDDDDEMSPFNSYIRVFRDDVWAAIEKVRQQLR